MPKKMGINSKAAEARDRKAAVKYSCFHPSIFEYF